MSVSIIKSNKSKLLHFAQCFNNLRNTQILSLFYVRFYPRYLAYITQTHLFPILNIQHISSTKLPPMAEEIT